MKYGLTRKVQIYGFENQESDEIIAVPGDNIQASLWASNNLGGVSDEIKGVLEAYLWAWFAMKRLRLLEKYDLADKPSQDNLIDMTNKVSIYLEDVKDDSLPLASAKQPKK